MADEETTETEEETSTSEETTEEATETTSEETSTEKTEPDWKQTSRKHERRAKQEKARANELDAELKKIRESNQTEQEKAIATAREEAKAEALSESQKDRRADRLEVAVTRLGAKGITLGEGDDAKTVKLADPEDAQVFIEKAIAAGDLDESDLFDSDGKVENDALTEALTDLLERKPHLAAVENGTSRSRGDAGGGRGGAATTDLETQSVDDHFKSIQRTGK